MPEAFGRSIAVTLRLSLRAMTRMLFPRVFF